MTYPHPAWLAVIVSFPLKSPHWLASPSLLLLAAGVTLWPQMRMAGHMRGGGTSLGSWDWEILRTGQNLQVRMVCVLMCTVSCAWVLCACVHVCAVLLCTVHVGSVHVWGAKLC